MFDLTILILCDRFDFDWCCYLKVTYHTLSPLLNTDPWGVNKVSVPCFGQIYYGWSTSGFFWPCRNQLYTAYLRTLSFIVSHCKWARSRPAPLLGLGWVQMSTDEYRCVHPCPWRYQVRGRNYYHYNDAHYDITKEQGSWANLKNSGLTYFTYCWLADTLDTQIYLLKCSMVGFLCHL